jgi:hypothetical protein
MLLRDLGASNKTLKVGIHQLFLYKQQNVLLLKVYLIHIFLRQISKQCLKQFLDLVNPSPGRTSQDGTHRKSTVRL